MGLDSAAIIAVGMGIRKRQCIHEEGREKDRGYKRQ